MVKKKKKIVVEPFDDIKIIGICTHLEDFKLAWHINKLLNVNLVKYSDIVNEDGLEFSFYLYDGGENCNTYNLGDFQLRRPLGYLLSSHRLSHRDS